MKLELTVYQLNHIEQVMTAARGVVNEDTHLVILKLLDAALNEQMDTLAAAYDAAHAN